MLKTKLKKQLLKYNFLFLGGNYKKIYSHNKIYLYFKYSNKYILNLKYLIHDISYFYNIIKNIILKNGKIFLVNEIEELNISLKRLKKYSRLSYNIFFINKWKFGFFTNNLYLKKNKLPSIIYLISLQFNNYLINELLSVNKPIIAIKNFEQSNKKVFYYNMLSNYKELNTHYLFLKILRFYLKKIFKFKKYNFFFKLYKTLNLKDNDGK